MNKSQRILEVIANSNGMRFTDIQKTLWEMTHPKGSFTRENRGYWCTNLLGGDFYHRGILKHFCVKGSDGLWRRNNTPIVKSIWSDISGPSATPPHLRH